MKYRVWVKKCKEYAWGMQYNCLALRFFTDEFDYLSRAMHFGGKTRHRRRNLRSGRRGNNRINKLRQVKDPPFDDKNSKQYRKYAKRLKKFLKEE